MGKHKYIETPEKMWELFEKYRLMTKAQPIRVQDYVGKDGDMVYRNKEKPLTMEGFENYCYQIVGCVEQYFKNQAKLYDAYIPICSHIRKSIRQDQIEGGMAGIYNPSITQRLNNLVERTDVTSNEETINEISVTIHKKGLIED